MNKNTDNNASNASAGVRLRLAERNQMEWKPQCLDELLAADHPARVIWAVVCGLDLSRFHEPIQARVGMCGRDSTDPRILTALWLYAAVRGVGSARELNRLCTESKPYIWLCGGVSVNYHLLADFRTGHGPALDGLFTDVIATLVKKDLVKVERISQDGLKIRASAGSNSFRRASTLETLRKEAAEHVGQLNQMLADPAASGGLGARKKAAKKRAAKERLERIDQALALIPKLRERQERAAKRLSAKQKKEQQKEPRAGTTDARASQMKMGNGGYSPAFNGQLAVDTQSRAIVGVDVSGEGNDYDLSEPMRRQVQERTGVKAREHLMDGGYTKIEHIESAAADGVAVYAPPKPVRNKDKRPDEFTPLPGDSVAIKQWRQRMGSEEGKTVYKQRASTSETVNARMRRSGLTQLTVRGLSKARSVLTWAALAYNVMLFAGALRSG
jgi:transposase